MQLKDLGLGIMLGTMVIITFSVLKVRTDIETFDVQLAAIENSVNTIKAAIPSKDNGPPMPDPNKQYVVDIGDAPVRGGENAQVTIVEFADFQCPFCSKVTSTLAQLSLEYGDKVRMVFKHLPLSFHPDSPAAHAAAEAAHSQGKFWEMSDKIFTNQSELKPEKFREYAKEMGLDLVKFDKDVASAEVKNRIDADTQQASKLTVAGTPAFFVNGRFISGAQPIEVFRKLIDEALAKS